MVFARARASTLMEVRIRAETAQDLAEHLVCTEVAVRVVGLVAG